MSSVHQPAVASALDDGGQSQPPVMQQPQLMDSGVSTPPVLPGHPQMPAQASAGMQRPLQLYDIHMPEPAPFWPLAPGWWLLAVLALLALAAGIWRVVNALRRRRRRARIIAQLDQLRDRFRDELSGPELVAAVSALLKRAALNRYPRREVAALSGDAWVAFLDRTGGAGGFTNGPGRILTDGVYAPRRDCDPDALLALAGLWLRKNL